MSFLVDTDICSAHLRCPSKLAQRFIQHTGQISISCVTLAELYAGAYEHSQVDRLLTLIADLLTDVQVLDFDSDCVDTFRQIRGTLRQQGIAVPTTDLMIASAALAHDLTMVTHNTKRFQSIPSLRLEDWMSP